MNVEERNRLRVWAAEVRDGGGPAAAQAQALCSLLDMLSGRAAENLKDGLRCSILMLVGQVVLDSGQCPGCCVGVATAAPSWPVMVPGKPR